MSLPSEQQVLQLFQGAVPPQYTMKRLIQHFAVAAEERPAFRDTIRALVARGRLTLLRGTRYTVPFRRDTRAGLVRRHTDGYGFVVAEEGAEDDIYLSRQAMQGVMHGDRVLVRLEPTAHQGERRSGRVLQVLERGQTAVVGRIEVYGKTCWVLPLDERLCPGIYVPPREQVRAKRGDIVVAEVSRYALAQEYPQGRIVEVLGHADDPDLEMRIILHTYELPTAFPPEVEAEAEAIPAAIAPEEWLRRRDLRRLLTCTIDGATARDFDDAVSLERLPNGHVRLGVHIADVSFYVQEDSAIDVEAAQRGTSVYFPDQVIPMLPGGLSHTLCCLQPDVDRLTLSVLLELTAEAQVVRYEIAETVIHSQARLTYTQVAAHLEGDSAA
ncbi:MAG: RNB domain-containing ribonuclease, partial [Candidatus Tectomicrobia bacterium]|nr:RNB domain-containing ribonuclease [Candidatus Tectomicrobia bacterium]